MADAIPAYLVQYDKNVTVDDDVPTDAVMAKLITSVCGLMGVEMTLLPDEPQVCVLLRHLTSPYVT